MPRNRVSKKVSRTPAKKRAAKQQKSNNASVMLQAIDNELMHAPANFAALVRKEATALAKKEAKLNKVANKLQHSIKTAEARIKAANKAKQTAATKKKLKVLMKAHATQVNQFDAVISEHEMLITTLTMLSQQIDKLEALEKHLNQFEKAWKKQQKAAKPAKAKAKRKTNAKRRTKQQEMDNSRLDMQDELMEDALFTETAGQDEPEIIEVTY